ncbi:mucin-5AC-like isoform X6 [Penaeus japonicus]|uniref:mucin-5AC-like isoform X6 n=1 Tax=Penaeus japonicus TaxID=27405 RepID=UPI001C715D3B|nr:mucin-5AC-like isoform X6 [Penaeus japonicus]
MVTPASLKMNFLRAVVIAVLAAAGATMSVSEIGEASDAWDLELLQETATTVWPERGCLYDGGWFAPGEGVPSTEPCLNCSCVDETLVCHLRVCAHVPDPVPEGCYVVRKTSECCGQVVCEKDLESNRLLRKETALEDAAGGGKATPDAWWRRDEVAEDAVAGTRRRGSAAANDTVKGCVTAGAVFAEGSAMASSDECSYCFCIRGSRRCVAPKCVLPVSGCRPRYRTFSCCPSDYDCQDAEATTTTTARTTLECVVEGRRYGAGARVETAAGPCESCFCLGGEVRCVTTTCAPPLDGCVPVMEPGRCCPVKYDCDGDTSKNQLLQLLQAKARSHDRRSEKWHTNMARRSASGDGIIVDTSDPQVSGVSGIGEVFWIKDVREGTSVAPPRPSEREPPSMREPVEVGTGMNVKGSIKNAVRFGPIYILDNRVRTDRQHRAENATETETTDEGEEATVTDIPEEETTILIKDTTPPAKENESEATREETTLSTDKIVDSEAPASELTTLTPVVLPQETTLKPVSEETFSTTTVPSEAIVEEGASSSTIATTQEESSVTDEFSNYTDIEYIDPDTDFPTYDITVGTSVLASPPAGPAAVGVGEVIPVKLEPEHKAPADSLDLDPEHKSPEELKPEHKDPEESEPATETPQSSIIGTLWNFFTQPERPERPRPIRPPRPPFSSRPGLGGRPRPGLEGRPRPGLEGRPRPDFRPRPGLIGRPRPGFEFRPRPGIDALPPPELEAVPPPDLEAVPPELEAASIPELEDKPTPETEDRTRPTLEDKASTDTEIIPDVEAGPQSDLEDPKLDVPSEVEDRPRPNLEIRPRPGLLGRPRPGGNFVPPRFRFTPATKTEEEPATDPSVTITTSPEPSPSTSSVPRFTLPAILPEPIHSPPAIVPIRSDFIPTRTEVAPVRPIGPFTRPAIQAGGAVDLPSKPIMEGGFQGIRGEGEGINPTLDYIDYDSDGEPTLPPSLPNLKIIPFVAADALTNQDVSFSGEDFRSTPRPIPLVPASAAEAATESIQPETTEVAPTSTTTRRPIIRPADRRPPVLPPRRQFRPSSDDSTTRRPFLPFRRPSDRTTRKPFGRPSLTSTPDAETPEDSEDSEPRLPFANRDRPFARPAFIPPRRPSTTTTTTETTEAPTDLPTLRPTTSTSRPELFPIQLTTRPQPIEVTTTTTTSTSRPIQSDDIANLLLQDAFELPEGQSSPPVRFTPARATPKPIVPVKLSTALPEIPSAVRDQLPLAIDPVLASGLLKLSACNIYGRMYKVGEKIPELSAVCKECQCTPVGVQCLPVC